MVKAAPALTRVERYKQLCRDVTKRLQCGADDPRVEHVATLTLMREAVQVRLLEGRNVEPNDVLKLDEALKAYMPPPETHAIKIQYVEGVVGIYRCQHCHQENRIPDGEYEPAGSRGVEDRDARGG